MIRIGCQFRPRRPLWSFTGAELWTQRLLLDGQVPRRDRILGRLLAIVIGVALAFALAACELRASVVSRPIRIVPITPPAPCDPSSSPQLPAQAKGACQPGVLTYDHGRRNDDAAANTAGA